MITCGSKFCQTNEERAELSWQEDRNLDFPLMLRAGLDPFEERNKARLAAQVEAAKTMTFDQCATAYIAAHRAGWKKEKHVAQWASTLEAYAGPVFGNLPVAEVDTGMVLKVLEPIWEDKHETATRLRGRIEQVLDWATTRNYRTGDNPARWKGQGRSRLRTRLDVRQAPPPNG